MDVTEEIGRICAEHGLDIESVALDADIAVITPKSLDELVDAETLAGIADDIRQFGIKHVALDLKP